ncbi:MAG: hypothetical protein KGL44_03815 [Sphingomonadales bacterium]|nr:hypothetical protein [Sphingomonadales bacterium]
MPQRHTLRPAPFALTPKAVRRLTDPALPLPASVSVKLIPVLPIKLVDHCPRGSRPANMNDKPKLKAGRRKEARPSMGSDALSRESAPSVSSGECIPRAGSTPAPANQVETPSATTDGGDEPARVAPAEAPAPVLQMAAPAALEDWPDAPLPDHADPDLDRPEPPAPELLPESLPEVEALQEEQLCLAEAQAAQARGNTAIGGGYDMFEPEARPARMPRPVKGKRGTIVIDEIGFVEPVAVLPVPNKARRALIRDAAEKLAKPELTKVDWARVAAAHRASGPTKSTSVPVPLHPAPSREECPRCGIPGWKGCDHFLPCEDQPRHVDLPEPMDRAEAQAFVAKRRPGASVSLKLAGTGVMRP